MKTTHILLTALLGLGLSSSALAQTAPAANSTNQQPGYPEPNGTNTNTSPTSTPPASTGEQVGTMKGGANIGNNRDRISAGAGTPATSAIDRKVTRANEQPRDKRKAKGKSKSKP